MICGFCASANANDPTSMIPCSFRCNSTKGSRNVNPTALAKKQLENLTEDCVDTCDEQQHNYGQVHVPSEGQLNKHSARVDAHLE